MTTLILVMVGMLAAGGGGVIGFLVKALQAKIKVSEAENEALKARRLAEEIQKQLDAANATILATKQQLTDALAALELLKAYKAIDDATKQKIEELQKLYEGGKATKPAMDKFKQILDEINKKNQSYNQGGGQKP